MVKKLMIFMPAYKTRHTVTKVIEKIPKSTLQKTTQIVVMDNNSDDKTYEHVLKYKKEKNFSKLKVFKHKKNIFFGGNLKAGLKYAVDNDMDIVAVLHSDGQYPANKINELIKPIEENKAKTTFGSRFLSNPRAGGMPLWRYAGNIFLTKLENVLVGKKFSEWHSGFCAYDVKALKKLPFLKCEGGYEFTTDILLLFISNKMPIAEIPIPTHYGEESTSPSIKRTFLYFVHSFRLAFTYFLHRIHILRIKKYLRQK